MKQRCHISFVYGSWMVIAGGLIFYLIQSNYVQAVSWVVFIALFLWLYVRYFPSLSGLMGYGSMVDQPAADIQPSGNKVVLYTGIGCPFCPIVKRRLVDLQKKMGFELREIDVTFKPGLLISKGIRALPVVSVGGSHWIGNATSEQLAVFIKNSATSA